MPTGSRIVLITSLFVIFTIILSSASADTATLTVESCTSVSGDVTITNCSGVNTSDNDVDITAEDDAILGTAMSNVGTLGTINSVSVTIRHSGESWISGTVGITMYDFQNSTSFCWEDSSISNSEDWQTDSITACTPTGDWDETKLNNLQVRVKNKDTPPWSQDMHLSYLVVTVDYTPPAAYCGDANCDPDENYSSCPQDCCEADCTGAADTICHSACNGYNGCSFASGCDGAGSGNTICVDSNSYVTCCEGTVTDCSAGQYCSGGSCLSCSTSCDNSCQSSACFGVDPDCDAAGNPTLVCCGDGSCEGDENCVTCSADCPGSVVCSSDTDCDDSNVLTTDTCINPGECDSYCTNVSCSVACGNDADCDDSNSLTIDVCFSPGTCDASCSNTPCTIACDSNSDCDDSNALTTDVCNSPGTCDASCSNTPSCTIACSSDADCDDSNAMTNDTCSNSGTCDASCSNTPCSIACSSNVDCDDGNATTTDSCVGPGTCDAYCTNLACSVECATSDDCDDADPETQDICNSPGTCDANCSHSACIIGCIRDSDCDDDNPATIDVCQNRGQCGSYCENLECVVVCYSDADCNDLDPHTADVCVDPGDCFSYCTYGECVIGCSSDDECDDEDPATTDSCINPGTCNAECRNEISPMKVELTRAITGSRKRKDTINISASVKMGAEAVEGATVIVYGPGGKDVTLIEGQGGIYSAAYILEANTPLGKLNFDVSATKEGKRAKTSFEITIEEAEILFNLIEPEDTSLNVGEEAEFRVEAAYKDGEVATGVTLEASFNEKVIEFEELSPGIYVAYYTVVEEDVGDANLSINTHDQYNNPGSTELAFAVSSVPAFVVDIFIIIAAVFFFVVLLLGVIALILFTLLSILLFTSKSKKKRLVFLEARKRELQLLKNYTKAEYSNKMIDKVHYDWLMLQYENKIGDAEKSVKFLKRQHFWDRYTNWSLNRTKGIFPSVPSREAIEKVPEDIMLSPPDIDKQIAEIDGMIKLLNEEFSKKMISEEEFRKRMFDYKSRIHLLEIKKKGS